MSRGYDERTYLYQLSQEEFQQHQGHLFLTAQAMGFKYCNDSYDYVRFLAMEKLLRYVPEQGYSFQNWSIMCVKQACWSFLSSKVRKSRRSLGLLSDEYLADSSELRKRYPKTYQPEIDDHGGELRTVLMDYMGKRSGKNRGGNYRGKDQEHMALWLDNDMSATKASRHTGVSRASISESVRRTFRILRSEPGFTEALKKGGFL